MTTPTPPPDPPERRVRTGFDRVADQHFPPLMALTVQLTVASVLHGAASLACLALATVTAGVWLVNTARQHRTRTRPTQQHTGHQTNAAPVRDPEER